MSFIDMLEGKGGWGADKENPHPIFLIKIMHFCD